jgi:biopolymer transport protein ExbD
VDVRHIIATLILISLLMLTGCTPRKQAAGIYLSLLRRGPEAFPQATDQDGSYIMRIQSRDVVRIRQETIRVENLGRRLEEVFRTRAEKLLLVQVEGQIEFADLIDVLDRGSSQIKLQYGLITDRTAPTPTEPSLFMHGKHVYTQYFLTANPLPLRPTSH